MQRVLHLVLCAALLGAMFSASAAADESKKQEVYSAQSGFEMLKTLAGHWLPKPDADGNTHGGSAVSFKVTANGTAVVATFYEGTPMEMISVFHMDGDNDLVHTHYCALGNQPTMRFAPSTVPGELKFLFAGGTNMDPDIDAHVHNTTIRFLSEDEIENDVETYAEGKKDDTLKIRLVRSGE